MPKASKKKGAKEADFKVGISSSAQRPPMLTMEESKSQARDRKEASLEHDQYLFQGAM
jgi:hypothetical protein